MGTIITGAVLFGVVVCIIREMVIDKKNGKSLHCGGCCKDCGCQCGKK